MASKLVPSQPLHHAVEKAANDLMRVRHWGTMSYINLPLSFPDGSSVTVRVMAGPGGYRVDDGGFAFRGLESAGMGQSFGRTAAKIAEPEELTVEQQVIFTYASDEQLSRAICDVGFASYAVTERVFSLHAEAEEGEIEDYLQSRLESIFGKASIDEGHTIVGSSTSEWKVSAILRHDGKQAVFHAVSGHANSVYRTSAAFHDLRELSTPPRLVAVVKDKAALGARLGILAQAGRVIQGDQADAAYLGATA